MTSSSERDQNYPRGTEDTPILDLQAFQRALGDSYEIGREIGRGGMATVFLATDRRHDRQVALKIVDTDAGMRAAERFEREIRLLARLQHPNILPVFDSGLADGRLWYAMPFIEGESLRARLGRDGPIDTGVAIAMLATLADALGYAHECGVIHRDIKPENILLSHSIPLIADFGIASAVDLAPGRKLTVTGMTIGTPEYMSPEQATGDPVIDGRSDIFSLGCVGFEMLTGRPPFQGVNPRAVIAQLLSNDVPSLRRLRSEVPPAVEHVIARAIAREPADRWQTGADFSAALRGARGSTPAGAGRRRFMGRSPRLVAIALATVLVAIAVASLSRHPRTDSPATPPRPTRHDTAAVSAYQRGTARVYQRTQRSMVEGLALIDQAIRRDSSFALAWAGRADALTWARQWEFRVPGIPVDSLLPRALDASERALDLDTLDAGIWLTSATILGTVDPTRSNLPLRAVRRAIALDSLDARAWMQLGSIQQENGEMDAALASMRRAMVLGGRAIGAPSYANHLYWRRQYDSAAAWSDSAIKYSSRLPYSWEMAGATALMRKHLEDAQTYYEAALRLDQGPTRVRSLEGLAEVAAIRGDTAKALRLIGDAARLTDSSAPGDHAVISIASAYASVGNTDKALEWLERYRPRGSLHFQLHLKRDPQLDPLRANARFIVLLSR